MVEFLTARLDEDEASAGRKRVIVFGRRARLLREVQAKRAIVASHSHFGAHRNAHDESVLRRLAVVWSDHPDYDPAWRT